MIEPIMFFGYWLSGREPVRARAHSARAQSRGAADHAAAGSGDAAVDGGNPGRQGSAARRIRDVDATARAVRRADEEPRPPASSPSSARRPTPSTASRSNSAKRPPPSSRSKRARSRCKDQLHATEVRALGQDRRAARSRAHAADKQAELAKLSADLGERSATADSQRVEIIALRTQVEALKDRVTGHEREAQEIGDRLDARTQGCRRSHRRAHRRARQGGKA